MEQDSDWEIAQAMVRMYGLEAEAIAVQHAEDHAERDEIALAQKWRRIVGIIAGLNRMPTH